MSIARELIGETLYLAVIENEISDFFKAYNKDLMEKTGLDDTLEVLRRKVKKVESKKMGKKKAEKELALATHSFWGKMEFFNKLMNPTPQFILYQMILESYELLCNYLSKESKAFEYMHKAFIEKKTCTTKENIMEYKDLQEKLQIEFVGKSFVVPAFSKKWTQKIDEMEKWQTNFLYRTHQYNDAIMSGARTEFFIQSFLKNQYEIAKETGHIGGFDNLDVTGKIPKIYERDVDFFSHLAARLAVGYELLEVIEEFEPMQGRYSDKDIWFAKQTLGRMKTFLTFFGDEIKGVQIHD